MDFSRVGDITIFTAGIDAEGDAWADSILGSANYEQYLEILDMLLSDIYTETKVDKKTLLESATEKINALQRFHESAHVHEHEEDEKKD